MNYTGVIIEESLVNKSILNEVHISKTTVEKVTEEHKTPWIAQWTLDEVEINEDKADMIARKISLDLDTEHPWYADFKNPQFHFIVYQNKVFKVDLMDPVLYTEAREYGISLGIPEYQVDFVPEDKVWNRV